MKIIVLQHIKIEDPGYIKDLMINDGADIHTIELDEGQKIPKDLTILKSTASYSICVLVEIIDVGIIIAKDVPTDKCILVTISKSKTVKA